MRKPRKRVEPKVRSLPKVRGMPVAEIEAQGMAVTTGIADIFIRIPGMCFSLTATDEIVADRKALAIYLRNVICTGSADVVGRTFDQQRIRIINKVLLDIKRCRREVRATVSGFGLRVVKRSRR